MYCFFSATLIFFFFFRFMDLLVLFCVCFAFALQECVLRYLLVLCSFLIHVSLVSFRGPSFYQIPCLLLLRLVSFWRISRTCYDISWVFVLYHSRMFTVHALHCVYSDILLSLDRVRVQFRRFSGTYVSWLFVLTPYVCLPSTHC